MHSAERHVSGKSKSKSLLFNPCQHICALLKLRTHAAVMASGLFDSYVKEYSAKSTELASKIEALAALSAGKCSKASGLHPCKWPVCPRLIGAFAPV
jgi:hypothetical protein